MDLAPGRIATGAAVVVPRQLLTVVPGVRRVVGMALYPLDLAPVLWRPPSSQWADLPHELLVIFGPVAVARVTDPELRIGALPLAAVQADLTEPVQVREAPHGL
jgi:hypothetical protein